MGTLWKIRRARAVHLLGQTPHAEEILTFYVGLTEAQESLADRVPVSDWSVRVRSPEGDFPSLRVERLPLDQLALPFQEFLSSVAGFGTDTIRDGAPGLCSPKTMTAGSSRFARRSPLGRLGTMPRRTQRTVTTSTFYARAFLEPVVTSIARADSISAHGLDREFLLRMWRATSGCRNPRSPRRCRSSQFDVLHVRYRVALSTPHVSSLW